MKINREYKAFTLIELLIVIVIIGILAGLIIFALRSATIRAREAQAKSSVRQVQQAVESVLTDNPNLADALGCTGGSGCKINSTMLGKLKDSLGEQLLQSVPKDGQDTQLVYKTYASSGFGNKYKIEAQSANDPAKCWEVNTRYLNRNNLDSNTPIECTMDTD